MTSVAHMDFPDIINNALSQMLSLVADPASDAELDVRLVGGFEDVLLKVWLRTPNFVIDFRGCYPQNQNS